MPGVSDPATTRKVIHFSQKWLYAVLCRSSRWSHLSSNSFREWSHSSAMIFPPYARSAGSFCLQQVFNSSIPSFFQHLPILLYTLRLHWHLFFHCSYFSSSLFLYRSLLLKQLQPVHGTFPEAERKRSINPRDVLGSFSVAISMAWSRLAATIWCWCLCCGLCRLMYYAGRVWKKSQPYCHYHSPALPPPNHRRQ